MNLVFFGSFQHYSTLILESLVRHPDIDVRAVVSTPPMPAGRKKELKSTHTHEFAKDNNIPDFTPAKLTNKSLNELKKLLHTKYDIRHTTSDENRTDSIRQLVIRYTRFSVHSRMRHAYGRKKSDHVAIGTTSYEKIGWEILQMTSREGPFPHVEKICSMAGRRISVPWST